MTVFQAKGRRQPALLLSAACLVALTACRRGDGSETSPAPAAASAVFEWFRDGTAQSGVSFMHVNGMSGRFLYPEVMPPGVAVFDYDGDQDLDIFVVQGHPLGATSPAQATTERDRRGRLLRNDLAARSEPTVSTPDSRLHFTDVTAASGLDARGYGMGVATGDIDNDGCVDLYVTNLGPNQLWKNNCDGTFRDVTRASGTADSGWSVPAAFVDVDHDGWLDLFVGHYLAYTVAGNVECFSVSGQPDYCPPHAYRAQPSRLFRNNRNGTFTDRTAAAGMATQFGPALGVSTADFNGDGWIDLYVANDGVPNQLWLNRGSGTFNDTALVAGAAVSPEGLAKASMGVDAGDVDNDGDEDLFIGELTGQGADLYVNDGRGLFVDESARSGLRLLTLPHTGFGAGWLDVDNDGLLDLAVVNGAVTHTAEALARQQRFALQQPRQLFRNAGNGRFEDASARAGAAFVRAEVGRGAAFGDLDNDGDTDLVVGNDNGPLRILVNEIGHRAHWLGLRLVGTDGRRDMLGARVSIETAGATLWRRARADGSYASASDPRVLAGLGRSDIVGPVTVYWPSRRVESFTSLTVDRYTTLVEGRGQLVAGAIP